LLVCSHSRLTPDKQRTDTNRYWKRTKGTLYVRFGSKADICNAPTHVRFTPNSDRKSGLPHKVMSALPLKADICIARAHVCYGPKADIEAAASTLLSNNFRYFFRLSDPKHDRPGIQYNGDKKDEVRRAHKVQTPNQAFEQASRTGNTDKIARNISNGIGWRDTRALAPFLILVLKQV
jgi:hypothetical protein